ncbi:MAG: UPF0104 family protein [Methanocalculus sp. MSAO_Arc1]|uniref:lysylphosphatidylglycerol synthase transmembrane domain-containing protein n=1 Tax=Methanocalculus TaxID=71151 RepID=UPI000FF56D46|nr:MULTISPECIES: lysylphosphatidylglycerol synthase transmembrane domain-containing protein [unclassified Methanocalculus]MCP1663080.1 uncharacterized membrane protein YbhN (UPF0104 family) [Methanocalculus sp. AMF5]RQD81753.1 MAG: UPF0104 family protein [Methanocalculus sp. MSAO_Arc1]
MLRKISTLLLSTAIAGGIIAFLLSRVWDELLITIQEADPRYLAAAAAICLLAWYLRGVRYSYILGRLSVLATGIFATACIFVSQTANLIVPARLGDLIRLLILKHEKETTYTTGFSSVLTERVFDLLTIALIGALALPFAIGHQEWFSIVIGIILLGGILFLILLWYSGSLSSQNRFIAKGIEILAQIRSVSLTPSALGTLLLSSIVIWLIDCLVCLMVVWMFGESVSVMVVILAIVVGNLVKAVPITPGGIGTYELALAMTFELAGVSAGAAVLIAVVDHLIKNLVTLAGGVLSIFYFGDWTVTLLKRAFSGDLRRDIH